MSSRHATRALAAFAALVLLGFSSPASAQLASALDTTTGTGACGGGCNTDGCCQSSAAFSTPNNGTTFTARYAWNINADVGIAATRDTSQSAQHSVTFTATAPGGYRLDIVTRRVGNIRLINDLIGCSGSADTSGVTGNSNVTLDVNPGSLTLGDPGGFGTTGTDQDVQINQTSSTGQVFNQSNGSAISHSLSFTWNGSVRSNSCEAAVRQGESSGTTTGCDACGYPGNPSRTAATDGHFVTVTFTSFCGNGTVEAPGNGVTAEECDQGGANGSGTSCCNANCTFRAAGQTCRASAGECDPAETCSGSSGTCPAVDAKLPNGTPCTSDGNPCTLDQCNGTNNTCQHPAGNAGMVCRGSAGLCDVVETCTGASTTCPADGFQTGGQCRASAGECDVAESCPGGTPNCPPDGKQPNGTACTSDGNPCTLDQCDGTNVTCQHPAGNAGATCRTSAGTCDIVETCTGASTTCPADAFQTGTECRASAGDCDVAESCPGGTPSCPADGFQSGTECRASAGDCDVAESCPGGTPSCPADGFQSGTECRAEAGDCDVAESCTGSGPNCPADGFQSGTECRASAGDCDVAESCTGSGPTCPLDAKSTAECRAAVDTCDVAETCDGVSDDCPADDVQPASTVCRAAAGTCDVAESCDGVSASCPADAVEPSGTECRASVGTCDIAESCDGSSPTCPADAVEPAGTECRPNAGDCDVAESCDGSSPACPADSVAGAFVTCRPAAGDCDQDDNCDGVNPACPPDAFEPNTVTCRVAAGACDLAENCTGSSATCPADAKSTAQCRAAAGTCDVAETCNGSSDTCPSDALAPLGTPCRASAGSCDVAESCTGLAAACPTDLFLPNGTVCNDGDSCTTPDACQGGVCTGTPAPETCADHFLCYKAKASPFTAITGVSLIDQFESATVTVVKPRAICTPASKNGGAIMDSNIHLKSYSIKQSTAHVRRTVTTVDQFGTLSLDTVKPDLLYVPTNKSLIASPGAPNIPSINVDHYKCYKIKVTPGTTKFAKGVTATVGDQFNAPAKNFNVKKPKHLCNPVNKNGEGTKNDDAHLVCYQVKGVKGQPKHVRTNIFVNNQFGPETMTTVKERELCVPASKTP